MSALNASFKNIADQNFRERLRAGSVARESRSWPNSWLRARLSQRKQTNRFTCAGYELSRKRHRHRLRRLLQHNRPAQTAPLRVPGGRPHGRYMVRSPSNCYLASFGIDATQEAVADHPDRQRRRTQRHHLLNHWKLSPSRSRTLQLPAQCPHPVAIHGQSSD